MGKTEDIIHFWKKKEIQSGAELDAAMKGREILLAYHTNKLDFPEVTLGLTENMFARGRVEAFTGEARTLFVIQDAKYAWNFFVNAFDQMRPLDESLIKNLHHELTVGTYDEEMYLHGEWPGEYKIGDYVTGKYEVGAPPEDVPEEIRELLDELSDVPGDQILTVAAYFHVKFENIHGFADGNGRVGRLIMNYFLVNHDYPVIIIHEQDRKQYMEALEAWDRIQDLKPMKQFLEQQMIKTWEDAV